MSHFECKVALITGASSGIGCQTAIHFASLKCTLAITGRNQTSLNETYEQCLATGLPADKIIAIIADLNNEEEIGRVFHQTISTFKRLDILINNAGGLIGGSLMNTPVAKFDQMMQTNVRSVYILVQLALPELIKTKGNIVNVSSVAGTRAFPNVIGYTVSKAALDQLTKCVALEVGPLGVRVNSVNPGVIVTEIHKRSGMNTDSYKQFLEHSKTTHAMGRVGTAKEVAMAIEFLASDEASFITGTLLPIDGGRGAMCAVIRE